LFRHPCGHLTTTDQFEADTFATGPSRIARRLIDWEVERSGICRRDARRIVAREARIAPGSLERLSAGRLKFPDRIAERLNALLVVKIERKIADLEHQRAIAVATGNRLRPIDLGRLDAALGEARKAIGKD
jgi:hypothetical protein